MLINTLGKFFTIFLLLSLPLGCGISKNGYNEPTIPELPFKSLSKYPFYSIYQAKLLVKTGKCKVANGSLDEKKMRLEDEDNGVRTFEIDNMQRFQNVIDTFIELDNANAVAILLPEFEWYPVYSFTTITCSFLTD